MLWCTACEITQNITQIIQKPATFSRHWKKLHQLLSNLNHHKVTQFSEDGYTSFFQKSRYLEKTWSIFRPRSSHLCRLFWNYFRPFILHQKCTRSKEKTWSIILLIHKLKIIFIYRQLFLESFIQWSGQIIICKHISAVCFKYVPRTDSS